MIHKGLLDKTEFVEAIETLHLNMPKKKCLNKLAEEASELATKILQRLNNPSKVKDDNILEEMVDVQMQLLIVSKYYLDFEILDMCKEKIAKMLAGRAVKKYKIPSKKRKAKLEKRKIKIDSDDTN